MLKSILDTLISGGPVMIPIIIVSLILWTLILEKRSRLRLEDIDADTFTGNIIKFVSGGEKKKAIDLCENTPGIVSGTIKTLLNNRKKTKQSLLKSTQETLLEDYPKLEQHLPTISTLATISPILGLLGTVTGMVSTFTSITLHGTGDPQSLAKGISEALITTQSGLIVAIPALFFHSHLVRKLDNIMNDLEKNITKIINILSKEN